MKKLPTIEKQLEKAIKKRKMPDAFFSKIPKNVRRVAFTVKGVESVRVIKRTFKSLEAARKRGESFNVWRQNFNPKTFVNDAHMATVYRTHLNTQANSAKFIRAREEKDKKPLLMYSAILDDVTRDSHRALDGVIRPVEDSFWNANLPPNGYNCRCTVVQLSTAQADLRRRAIRKRQNAILKKNGKPALPASRSISTSKREIKHLQKQLKARPDKGFATSLKQNTTKGIDKYVETIKKDVPQASRSDILILLNNRVRERQTAEYFESIKDDLKKLRNKNAKKR